MSEGTHAVVRKDGVLRVRSIALVPRDAEVLHRGNVKDCRTFVARHRKVKKEKTEE